MVTKEDIRTKVWDYLESNNLANFPRPVHHRIPNFKGAGAAAHKLAGLKVFQTARVFKVNPDKPQEEVRFLILQDQRNTLLVPTPRLRHGLFNRIVPPSGASKEILRRCATAQGVTQYGTPVGLDDSIKVDMIVIGSVAVSPTGLRIGKGEGFADLEVAMMRTMGAIDEDTLIVSTVHDCQVVDIPEQLYAPHDVCVDLIVTPTQVIEVQPRRAKPSGILWSHLTREKFRQVPILKVLREREAALGVDCRLKEEREAPAGEEEHQRRPHPQRRSDDFLPSLVATDIPSGTRVSEFKAALRGLEALPVHLNWDGRHRRAFLDFKDIDALNGALAKLAELQLSGQPVPVEVSRRTKERMGL